MHSKIFYIPITWNKVNRSKKKQVSFLIDDGVYRRFSSCVMLSGSNGKRLNRIVEELMQSYIKNNCHEFFKRDDI
jgi:hypothetical protein